MKIPVLFQTDAYKLGHIEMYPENITHLYSNFTNRKSRIDRLDFVVHFGLQGFIQEILVDGFEYFFKTPKKEAVQEYRDMLNHVFGPNNNIRTEHIEKLHDLGYVPLKIKSLPEGTKVPLGVPSFTIENTVPGFAWLVNYVESCVSASVWHPSTSATIAYSTRKMLNQKAKETGMPEEFTDFQMHDFSFRGQTSPYSSAMSGAGHLLSSLGSDTIPSLPWIQKNYPGDNGMILGSVPASEHSVMCSYVETEFDENENRLPVDESQTYKELLNRFPEGIISLVSDTYDFFAVLRMFSKENNIELYEQVMKRKGKLVFRPDSGNPIHIINGDPEAPEGTDENKGALKVLDEIFGSTVNEAGFKVLDEHVGLIYGDGMYYEVMEEMINGMIKNGFASQVVFGVGSYTYQMTTRDTFNSAVKATYAKFSDGSEKALMKDPKTGSNKRSARGKLAVVKNGNDKLELIENVTDDSILKDELSIVWKDGLFFKRFSFKEVRDNLWS